MFFVPPVAVDVLRLIQAAEESTVAATIDWLANVSAPLKTKTENYVCPGTSSYLIRKGDAFSIQMNTVGLKW